MENGTDLDSVLNDQPAQEPQAIEAAPEPVNQGDTQAEPPAAKQQEPDHVPRAALVDERRKRQELEQRLAAFEQQFRQQAQPQHVQQAQKEIQRPQLSQFQTYEDYEAARDAYLEAKAEEKAAKALEVQLRRMSEAQQVAQVRQQTAEALAPMVQEGSQKYADFQDVIANPSVPISDSMMNLMLVIDGGHDVAYHFGKNPHEAARIYQMPPAMQAKEIRSLAKQLAAPAPAPVAPQLPKTLTQTRSTDGRFTKPGAWNGPTPLNDLLK